MNLIYIKWALFNSRIYRGTKVSMQILIDNFLSFISILQPWYLQYKYTCILLDEFINIVLYIDILRYNAYSHIFDWINCVWYQTENKLDSRVD